jgi:hypothetical protein
MNDLTGEGQMKGSRFSWERIIGYNASMSLGRNTEEVCRRHETAS